MLLAAAPPFQLFSLPGGVRGTRATLKLMAQLVREYRVDPLIRGTAADLVKFVGPQNFTDEVRQVFGFVQARIRYLQDVNDVETIQTPDATMQLGYGDCDDKSTLLASLLESIGHPARFVAVGYDNPGEFQHVYVETRIGNEWVAADASVADVQLGWAPRAPYTDLNPVCSMVHSI